METIQIEKDGHTIETAYEGILVTHEHGGVMIGRTTLAVLGYVTWRPASEKPEKEGRYPVALLGDDGKHFWMKMLFDQGSWEGPPWRSEMLYWLPLPALPGKGE